MAKPYKLGLIVGRFQSFHNGHEQMIRKGLEVCDKVIVFIGSAQESNTCNNPFSYEIRKEILSDVFGEDIFDGNVLIRPLKDIGVGNVSSWGAYVLSRAKEECGIYPDILITGKEERRVSWFDAEKVSISELYLPKTIDISASVMRENMIQDNRDFWKSYINPKVWNRYNALRKIVLDSQKNKNTMSI